MRMPREQSRVGLVCGCRRARHQQVAARAAQDGAASVGERMGARGRQARHIHRHAHRAWRRNGRPCAEAQRAGIEPHTAQPERLALEPRPLAEPVRRGTLL